MLNLSKISQMAAALTVSMMAITAQARYVVADYQRQGIDSNKKTHVIIAAKGGDMGLQFHMSAAALARKVQDVNPKDQVVMIAVLDNGKGWLETDYSRRLETSLLNFNILNEKNENDVARFGQQSNFKRYTEVEEGTKLALQQWGFGSFREVRDDLDAKTLINELSQFNQIGSVNIFSHSTSYYGLILDGSMNRLDPKDTEKFGELRSRFTSDAYAWLHGCNNSAVGAKLTSLWSIPVAASFTSTAFQEVFRGSDNKPFFVHSYPDNIPTGTRRVGVNSISYAKTQECLKVPCIRMQPDNYGYVGHWGNYKDGGLGFYKFVCASHVGDQKCKMGMAIGLINQVSHVFTNYKSDLSTFKAAAVGALCPIGKKFEKSNMNHEQCGQALEASLTNPNVTVDTFLSKSLECNRKNNCQIKVTCEASEAFGQSFLSAKSCKIENRRDFSKPITTQVQEYRDLVEGFQLLQRSQLGQ